MKSWTCDSSSLKMSSPIAQFTRARTNTHARARTHTHTVGQQRTVMLLKENTFGLLGEHLYGVVLPARKRAGLSWAELAETGQWRLVEERKVVEAEQD